MGRDTVTQLQFLDQPVVTMGLSRTVSEKNSNFRQKNRIFYIGSLTPPPKGEFSNTSYCFDPSIGRYEIILQRLKTNSQGLLLESGS